MPEGDRDDRGPERSRSGPASAAPPSGRELRADRLADRARRDRRAARRRHARARGRGGRLVHGQPGRLQLLAPALGQGLPRRARLPALLHGLLPGRLEPVRGELAALRIAVPAADPRPRADRAAARRRGEPAGLARLGDERAADQGSAPRDHRARRARGRRRSAPIGDGPRVRAPPAAPRLRREAAPLAAAGDVRGVARGRRGARRRGRRRRSPRAASLRSPRRRPPRRPASSRVASALSPATSRPPTAPRSTAGPARAWAATAPSSRSCSTRSPSRPGTSTAPAARCSARRRSRSSGSRS